MQTMARSLPRGHVGHMQGTSRQERSLRGRGGAWGCQTARHGTPVRTCVAGSHNEQALKHRPGPRHQDRTDQCSKTMVSRGQVLCADLLQGETMTAPPPELEAPCPEGLPGAERWAALSKVLLWKETQKDQASWEAGSRKQGTHTHLLSHQAGTQHPQPAGPAQKHGHRACTHRKHKTTSQVRLLLCLVIWEENACREHDYTEQMMTQEQAPRLRC